MRLDSENARTHTPRNLDAIEASLKRFGQQRHPVVGRDGVVIAGNGLVIAARRLGWTHLDILRTSLEGNEARAFAIADNRTAELAEWDRGQLIGTLRDFSDSDLLAATGFSESEFRAFLANMEAPEDFQEVTEDLETNTECPKCGFKWNG